MAFRDGPLQDLKVPLVWTGAISVVLAGIVALGVLLTDNRARPDGGAYGAARGEFDQAIRPVSSALAWPLRTLGGLGADMSGYFFAVSENRTLRARIKELERVRDEEIALRNVNTRYEQLLKLRTDPPVPMITARVITDVRGPFSNARLADAGRAAGVRVGYPVMSDHGAVGRVVGVGETVSRILLLTDVDSRTPVLIDRTGSRAILTGDGGGAPRLEYLRGPSPVKQGDVVLTSGDGGVFPRGLPIGVAAQDVRGAWRVRLYAEAQDVDYVRILQFDDFSKLPPSADLTAKAPPPLPAADAAQLQAATAARSGAPPAAFSGVTPGAAPAASTTPGRPVAAPAQAPAAVKPMGAAPAPSSASASAPQEVTPATPKPAAAKPKALPKSTTVATTIHAAATTKPKTSAASTSVKKPKPKAKLAPGKDRMAPIPNPPAVRSHAMTPDELESALRRSDAR